MMVTHEVSSFEQWKEAFDAAASDRMQGGITIIAVYTAADNRNLITVVSEAESVETAREYARRPAMQNFVAQAGIISRPQIKVLKKAL